MTTQITDPAVRLRIPTSTDSSALAELLSRNREHFATGEPLRPPEYYTRDHQEMVINQAQHARDTDRSYLWLIELDGELVGRFNLNTVIRGAFQSASVGYLVDRSVTGRGIATAALRQAIKLAFTDLRLHRLQAETRTDNHASQRVLTRCGFTHYGTASAYLRIQGAWRDHDLFQLINPSMDN